MTQLRRIIVVGSLVALLAGVTVLAQTGAVNSTAGSLNHAGTPKERIKEVRETRQDIRAELQEKRREVKASVQEKKEEVKTRVEEKKTELRAKLAEQKQKLIRSYALRSVRNLTVAIDRLENIADRIDTRLDKLAEENVSVTESRTKLEAARQKIAEAKMAVAAISDAIETLVSSETPKAEFEKVRAVITTAQDKVKEAHGALVDVINGIKPGAKTTTSTPGDK